MHIKINNIYRIIVTMLCLILILILSPTFIHGYMQHAILPYYRQQRYHHEYIITRKLITNKVENYYLGQEGHTSKLSLLKPLYSSNSDNIIRKEKEEDTEKKYYRSIGEVVGGLHGGKYQFDSFGMGFTNNDLYSSNQESTQCDENDEEDDILPNWFLKMTLPNSYANMNRNNNNPSLISTLQVVQVPSRSKSIENNLSSFNYNTDYRNDPIISIHNDERTWEKFYTKIVSIYSPTSSDDCRSEPIVNEYYESSSSSQSASSQKIPLFSIQPQKGYLAPRGGANNACDESKPYLDSATIRIFHNEQYNGGDDKHIEWWLVVGTEAEKWYYKLELIS